MQQITLHVGEKSLMRLFIALGYKCAYSLIPVLFIYADLLFNISCVHAQTILRSCITCVTYKTQYTGSQGKRT